MGYASQIGAMEFLIDILDNIFAQGAALCAVTAAISIFMERRRSKRKNLDKTGFMPWNLLSVIATLGTVMLIALAIKIG